MIRLATRGSTLAQAQARIAAAALEARGVESELVVVRTEGDVRQDVPVSAMEGQGWFTAELERALLDGRADVAVHSAKDLPTELAPGLRIAALLERADPRDGVVVASGGVRGSAAGMAAAGGGVPAAVLGGLPTGARVGTSSARRAALLLDVHPGLQVAPLRGNVDTRLRKLEVGEVDALVLACAGLDRIGAGEWIAERLDPAVLVPAPAQGAIALEVLDGSELFDVLAPLDHAATSTAIRAERALLRALGGGCLLPLGAHATLVNGELRLVAALGTDRGVRRAEDRGDPHEPEALAKRVAGQLR